jgi:hypothetical protein
MTIACYWIEWVIEFDLICKKRKEQCRCEKRNEYNVDIKLQTDIIWLVWDTLLHYCKLMNDPFIDSIIKSLLSLFCIKYTNASAKKRRYLLYFAVSLLTETVPSNIEMISDKAVLQNVVQQINNIYKQIKKNEEKPNTDYLFSNLEKQNTFEESMKKMELMNKMMGAI